MPPQSLSARSVRATTPASALPRSSHSYRGRSDGTSRSRRVSRASRSRTQASSSRGGGATFVQQQRSQYGPRTPSVASRSSASGRSHYSAASSPAVHRSRPRRGLSPINDGSVVAAAPEQDQPEGSVVDEVIMAVDMKEKFTIGCASFSTIDGALSVCQDIPMATLDTVEQLIVHVQPTTILVSARAPEELLDFLETRSRPSEEEAEPAHYILRALASSDFANDIARERLMGIRLDSDQHVQAMVSSVDETTLGTENPTGPTLSREAWHIKTLRCGTLVNLDCHASINATGAVLADLHRRRSIGFLPDAQAAEVVFHIRTLQTFSLLNSMYVSAETMESLQIVQSELHPNSQVWGPDPNGGGSKESLSVYGLFHVLAVTPQGRTTLRLMFLRPSLDLGLIEERQRTITLFMRPENADLVKQASQVLKRVRNARSAVSNLKRGIDSPSFKQSFDRGVWATLRGFSSHALRLREIVKTLAGAETVEIIRKVSDMIQPPELMAVGDAINKTIDFEQSKSRFRPSVKTGIDPQLDELKRRYEGMSSFLTEVVNDINQQAPEWAAQYITQCIFLPQLGFLTMVEFDPGTGRGRYEGEGLDDDQWLRVFASDGCAYYKNKFMKELDENHGDAYCEIGDREVEIIHELAKYVLRFEKALETTSDICGEFDALLALAKGAETYSWTRPQITDTPTIDIVGGRHPLQELVVPSFVPNDCTLGAGCVLEDSQQGRVPTTLALTGPNHSGKSIYLKQTAIIVYLAHIGSFVPADKATVGVTDKILTRISTRESISRNESAFAADLRQIGTTIKFATPKSLVIIDEFGKGTNADDGAGLLAATLEHFLSAASGTPRLVLATHFHELFEGPYLAQYSNLRIAHMEVRTDLATSPSANQITYLFNLKPGHSSSSFGGQCALLNGVPSAIVQRAEALSRLLARNEDLVSSCAKLSEHEELSLQAAEGAARRFLCVDLEAMPGTNNDSRDMKRVLSGILEA